MKIYRPWLQTFFDAPLPDAQQLADALTFHAFEIESIEDDVLDVKITANRGHDCLSHRGIAKELSAILQMPLKTDPLRLHPDLSTVTDRVTVDIAEPALCRRYVAGHIRGVHVGPSPEWLRHFLESIGQRSINNVVDATNYVMFHLGQPLHAFDAGRLIERNGYAIRVRKARDGERMVALDEKEYTLDSSMLVIADAHADSAIGIAGVKGGAPAGITEETSDIIIESANFDGVTTRKTAQKLRLRTDASARFEQVLSPELAAYGMHAVAQLIKELAGGELTGFVDTYPVVQEKQTARVSVQKINAVLGTSFTADDVAGVFTRLDLAHVQQGDDFEVHVPFERLDLVIEEDLIEEVGRIMGYEHVPAAELPAQSEKPVINANFYNAEAMREFLRARGFSEVFTSVFVEKGDRVVLNKVDGVKPYLRDSIAPSLEEALARNVRNKDLLGVAQVKLFEIGTVWKKGEETVEIELAVEKLKKHKTKEDYEKELAEHVARIATADSYDVTEGSSAERYAPYSKYPFIVRDVALWTPSGTKPEDVLSLIRSHAGDLLVRSSLFDQFEKDGRISFAFRLVFQSFDKTLTDGEVGERMDSIYAALKEKSYEIR